MNDLTSYNLALPFYRYALQDPEHLALWVEGKAYCYGELSSIAGNIADWLTPGGLGEAARVGILASRSLEAYAGILGSAWAGAAHVPISPHIPPSRIARILELSNVDALIVDKAGLTRLTPEVLVHAPRRILAPGFPSSALPGDALVSGADAISRRANFGPKPGSGNDPAYIIFTSGTTGVPKGVVISKGNVKAFLASVETRYAMSPADRVSQSYELTFDPSIADMFWGWGKGASLHVVPGSELMAPDGFIREHSLTVWSSVPSTIAMLQRMRRLKSGVFPSLKYSYFGGEPLPPESARAWQEAAPATIIDNLYGPTEATVACTGYRVSEPLHVTPERQILAIGSPFPGTEAKIVSPSMEFLPHGPVGELALSGPQLAIGYLDDPAKTAARFPCIGDGRWYLTGDLAYQDSTGIFHVLGRVDNQVKVLGNRVELEEVDAHLRDASGTGMAATVAWPIEQGTARGLVCFVCGPIRSIAEMQERMRERVPPYMLPARIIALEGLPLTAHGKVDRKALLQMLDEGAHSDTQRP